MEVNAIFGILEITLNTLQVTFQDPPDAACVQKIYWSYIFLDSRYIDRLIDGPVLVISREPEPGCLVVLVVGDVQVVRSSRQDLPTLIDR